MLKKVEPGPQENHLLAALSTDVQNRIFPHLELVSMPLHGLLYESNQIMPHVYFPTNSTISLQYLMEDGESTAISVVGNEAFLGVNLSMDTKATLR